MSLDDLQVKYNVHLNFFEYFQLIAAIPSCLKRTAQEIAVTKRDLRPVYTTEKIGTARIKRRTAPTKFDV